MKNINKTETLNLCEICDSETLKLHCKIICHNCGFIRDCSDP